MELQEAIEAIFDEDAILFLGSGFSLGAVNILGREFMTGPVLADHFANLTGLPQGTKLDYVTQAFIQKEGVDALIQKVQEEFTAKEVREYHRKVAALPWKRVYTTNYDNVFEQASQLEEKVLTTVTTSSSVYKIPKNHTTCIHLNGYENGGVRSYITTILDCFGRKTKAKRSFAG